MKDGDDDSVGEDLRRRVPVLAEAGTIAGARRRRTARRCGVVILAIVVILAVAEAFGPRDRTVTDEAPDGSALTVRYPQLTRPGLETEVAVEWRRPSSITEDVHVIIDQSMMSDLGVELITPQPREQRSAGQQLHLTFDPPEDDEFSVLISGRLPTRETIGSHRYTLGIEGAGGSTIEARTWVLP
ncbi:hypothetical protein [uncultured Aeromicrobium sp.]|uniref:hypothetical protein n=1 Tax=uncultured Aeromicrobium sp. TaxID=337820 RepID=UPI0025DC2929|nr:hypothetical protein [uncultured Aeromicrobium sp.]